MQKGSGYISLGNESLHYMITGAGKKLLLAFHGYNNTAGIFLPFAEYLGKEYTLLCIDLPHHGKSDWPDSKQFETAELKKLVHIFMAEYEVSKVSLLGYSMGGRVCLKILELLPEQIDKVLLIAPDGLAFNPFYYFVTRTFIGRSMFRRFLGNPQKYMHLLEWTRKKNLLDEARYRFAMQYLHTQEARDFLLKVWPGMSQLVPDGAQLRKAIKKHGVPMFIFMGNYDKVIPVSQAQKFCRQLETVQLHILEKGHRVFDSDTLPVMAQCLLS